MHSRFQDLVPVHLKDEGDPELEQPSEEDIEEVHLQNFSKKINYCSVASKNLSLL